MRSIIFLLTNLSLPRAAVEIKTQVHTGLRAQIGQRSVWQTRGNSITLSHPRFRCFLIQNASMGVIFDYAAFLLNDLCNISVSNGRHLPRGSAA